jgi:hypothetical protein
MTDPACMPMSRRRERAGDPDGWRLETPTSWTRTRAGTRPGRINGHPSRPVAGALLLTVAVAILPGCAVVALPAAALSVVGAAAGETIRAGTEYTASGVAYRTLPVSLDDVTHATRETLRRMAFPVDRDELTREGRRIVARAERRRISVRLQRLSPATTRIRLVVTQSLIFRDRSTASEIITRLEEALIRTGTLALPRFSQPARGPSARRQADPADCRGAS